MTKQLRNYLFLNRPLRRPFLILALLLSTVFLSGQRIGNYVNNGSFEEYFMPDAIYRIPYYWSSLDTSKYNGVLLVTPYYVPSCSFTFQYPFHGLNHYISTTYSYFSSNNRGYPRNRLKGTLISGKTYCVKMYVNLSNQSTHGIDQLGVYFGGTALDTITQCTNPITYLVPQIKNPDHNIITDTLNWVPITGTFVANGTEKYLLFGNFKSNTNTDTLLTNPTNLPAKATEYLIDALSCIELDLPAYAGRDTIVTPGTPVFIGCEPDFAIDPGCTWYQWPNMSVPIYDKAGLWVNPIVTTTYIVKQVLDCSPEKWDTVVIYMSPVGVEKLRLLEQDLKIFPVPASNFVELRTENKNLVNDFTKLTVYNQLGQSIREEEIRFIEGGLTVNISHLPDGVYSIRITNESQEAVSKRILIKR